ncbi:DUF6994 family protein [Ruminococcus sp.]|uniref:DUF6994 family protein n=1 Tax=Ruminococcus sp. TaxID=41978 RepID=UPI0039678087
METNKKIKSYGLTSLNGDYKKYLVGLLSTYYKCVMNDEAAKKEKNRIDDILKERGVVCNNIYTDPDGKKNTGFYKDLSDFLNAARISRKNDKIISFEANEAPYGMITVYYKDQYGNEQHFTVHSDQLGFSAVCLKYFRKNYPLSRYLEMQKNKLDKLKNKSDKKLETVAKFLSEYVYTTRTLGGSFLWPEDWYKGYNMERGNGSYIEDRVDLTLLEIKHIYKFRELENQLIYGKDYLFKRYKNQYADKWFGFFDSFEDYVDFFMFNDFVEDISTNGKKEYMPINILTGKRFKTDYPGYEMDTLKDIKEYKLKAMLERVRDMVEKRTIRMEDLINEYKQTNDTKGEKHENILHE